MRYGWTATNVLDIWNKPRYNSERVNQLLFTDPVRVIKQDSGYLFIEKDDGYQGWVDKRFISFFPKKEYLTSLDSRTAIVITHHTKTDSKVLQSTVSPYLLYYGTKLAVAFVEKNHAFVTLPDKTRISLKLSDIKPIIDKKQVTGLQLINEAKKLIGVPYLWGGISSTGLDCSGFVQTVCSCFGLKISRDTNTQIKEGLEVDSETIKCGDLLFFKRHVGFALGDGNMIHSSIGSNGVKIESLVKGNKDYRKDLALNLKSVRRII